MRKRTAVMRITPNMIGIMAGKNEESFCFSIILAGIIMTPKIAMKITQKGKRLLNMGNSLMICSDAVTPAISLVSNGCTIRFHPVKIPCYKLKV